MRRALFVITSFQCRAELSSSPPLCEIMPGSCLGDVVADDVLLHYTLFCAAFLPCERWLYIIYDNDILISWYPDIPTNLWWSTTSIFPLCTWSGNWKLIPLLIMFTPRLASCHYSTDNKRKSSSFITNTKNLLIEYWLKDAVTRPILLFLNPHSYHQDHKELDRNQSAMFNSICLTPLNIRRPRW